MSTNSKWISESELPGFSRLDADIKVDVAVIGGGITGVTTAYLLKRAGVRVALLERDRLGRGETGHTTAHLTYVTDVRLSKLESTFGRDHAQAAWDAGNAALQFIYDTVRRERIACELTLVPGYLHLPRELASESDLIEELEYEAQLAELLGFDAAYMETVPVVGRPGIRFANQGKFHPLKYLKGLVAGIPGQGSHIFEQSETQEFSKDPLRIKANDHWIECDYVVIATHVPLLGDTSLLSGTLFQSKLAAFSTYAVVGATLPAGLYPAASFWDTADPYHYLRIDHHENQDYAIFGGQDHKTGQAADTQQCFDQLGDKLHAILPAAEIDHHWSGQVIETNDGLPLIGEIIPGQFIATGFAGNGLTFGTLAAIMACDAVLKRKNPWSDLFDVRRKKLSGTWDYVKQNADYPYYMVKDRLKAADGKSLAGLRRGEGKILTLDGKKFACHRDEAGDVHAVSSVCTHMGCIVHWNAAEATWDCPCHGSRFKPPGEVIAGPAEAPLATAAVTGRETAQTAQAPAANR